jgi:2-oxoglutarate ferredoxin oxidoreductase subunit gamma
MQENKHVTWFPSYGAEVRGGTAYCMVVVSDKEISSPHISKADALIILNAPSLGRFKNRLSPGGLFLLNSSMVSMHGLGRKVILLQYPFTDIAVRLGNIKVTNTVALGCLLAHRGIVRKESVFKVIQEAAPCDKKEIALINKKALEEGMKLK